MWGSVSYEHKYEEAYTGVHKFSKNLGARNLANADNPQMLDATCRSGFVHP